MRLSIDTLCTTSHREGGIIPQGKDKRLDSRRQKQPAVIPGSREFWAFKSFERGTPLSELVFPSCLYVFVQSGSGGGGGGDGPLDSC